MKVLEINVPPLMWSLLKLNVRTASLKQFTAHFSQMKREDMCTEEMILLVSKSNKCTAWV